MGLITWLGGLDWIEFAMGWAERIVPLVALRYSEVSLPDRLRWIDLWLLPERGGK